MSDIESLTPSNTSVPVNITSAVCRICQLREKEERLISPCLCKGSLAYVHLSCLDRWLNQACRSYCEICRFRFETIEKRRYKMCQSIAIWVRHPRNWPMIRANMILMMLLTLFTAGLAMTFILGLKHFVTEGEKVGIPSLWTTVVVVFFLALVGVVYFVTVLLYLRDQITPWYNWWSRCVNVQLLLDSDQLASVQNRSETRMSETHSKCSQNLVTDIKESKTAKISDEQK